MTHKYGSWLVMPRCPTAEDIKYGVLFALLCSVGRILLCYAWHRLLLCALPYFLKCH